MQKILDLVNPILDSEELPEVVKQRLRSRLVRAVADSHRRANETLQQELGVVVLQLDETRRQVERLLYPQPLERDTPE